MEKKKQNIQQFLQKTLLQSPVLWGCVVSVGAYAIIASSLKNNQFIQRYFANHPVEYIATTMFFVGMAALLIKTINLLYQRSKLSEQVIEAAPRDGQKVEDCPHLRKQLNELPDAVQEHYLARRMREVIQFVQRKGSSEGLDEQLRYLADADASRQYESYSLIRMILWAIPILGFLGTVIGITLAIANLSLEAGESFKEVVSGLGVAFDTTALGLGLSIVLMFSKYFVENIETQLLENIDARVESEIVGRFEQTGSGHDPYVNSVRKMAETVVKSSQNLVHDQTEIWRETINAAHRHWGKLTESTAKQTEDALASALQRSLKTHAGELALAQRSSAELNRRHWNSIQQSLDKNAEAMLLQQKSMESQSQILLKVIEATGQVTQLEQSLNKNLSALAGAGHFQETVTSLAAAIQLLSVRLGQAGINSPHVDLSASSQQEQQAA